MTLNEKRLRELYKSKDAPYIATTPVPGRKLQPWIAAVLILAGVLGLVLLAMSQVTK